MPEDFDLVVVGTGSAALSVAYPCREAGWTVAVGDSRPYGGTCANRGCDPKKVLVGAGDVVDWAHRMTGHGLRGDGLRIDWPELMRFKRTFTDPVPDSRERALEKAGIARFHGVASFRDRHTIDFAGHSLTARHFVIASGAAPVPLGIPGEDLLLTSDDFLELETLPRRMVFIGGGYIAFEFAHLAARAGSQVTILHRGARALERFDSTLVDQLTAWTRQIGIDVRLNAPVTRVERAGAGFVVHAGDSSVEAVAVVHAAGRAANIGALNLAGAGVESTGRGVTVNEFLQSPSNPAVYAAGDSAASGPQLTPIAGYHGRVVAANLLRGNHLSPNYDGFASTVFTVPPLASTGLTEDEARKRSLDFDVHAGDSSNWYSTRRVAAECSGYKILIEKTTDRILGAHILGPGAEEMINVFALAIRHRLSATAVRETLFAYPTHGSDAQYML